MIFIDHEEALDGKIFIVEIKGSLNSETSTDFEEYINQLLEKKTIFIILDVKNLDYISSAGIGAILYIQKKILAKGGFLIITSISEEISTLFKLLGFDKVINFIGSKDEGIQIMNKQLNLISDQDNNQIIEETIIEKETSSISLKENSQAIETSSYGTVEEIEEGKAFHDPIILECAECKSMIRVKKSGNYICPDCKSEFLVKSDQTIIF